MEKGEEIVWRMLMQNKMYIIHIEYDNEGKEVSPMETKGKYVGFLINKNDKSKTILEFNVFGKPYFVLVKYPKNKFYEIIEPTTEESVCAICQEPNNEFSLEVCESNPSHKFHVDCFCPYAKSTKVSAKQYMPTDVDGVNIDTGSNFNVNLQCPICAAKIKNEVLELCDGFEGGRKQKRKLIRKTYKKYKKSKRRHNKTRQRSTRK